MDTFPAYWKFKDEDVLAQEALQHIVDRHRNIWERVWAVGDTYHKCQGCDQQVWVDSRKRNEDCCDTMRLARYIAAEKGWSLDDELIDATEEQRKRLAALRE